MKKGSKRWRSHPRHPPQPLCEEQMYTKGSKLPMLTSALKGTTASHYFHTQKVNSRKWRPAASSRCVVAFLARGRGIFWVYFGYMFAYTSGAAMTSVGKAVRCICSLPCDTSVQPSNKVHFCSSLVFDSIASRISAGSGALCSSNPKTTIAVP